MTGPPSCSALSTVSAGARASRTTCQLRALVWRRVDATHGRQIRVEQPRQDAQLLARRARATRVSIQWLVRGYDRRKTRVKTVIQQLEEFFFGPWRGRMRAVVVQNEHFGVANRVETAIVGHV